MDYQIVLSCLKKALEKTIYEFSKKLQENVSTDIYQTPESNYYDRTGEFLHAVESPKLNIKSNGDFTIDWYDKKKLHSTNGEEGTFGHHKSFPWKKPNPGNAVVKGNLYGWLNEGFTIFKHIHHDGFNFDEGIDFEPGSPFYEKFVENAVYEIKKYLRKGE